MTTRHIINARHAKFAVPTAVLSVFLAVATSGCAGVRITPVGTGPGRGVSNADSLFTEVLHAHVEDGLVDYAALGKDPRFVRYISWLQRADPGAMEDDADGLAFWINVYNAWTLKLIADNYPVESINDLHTGGRILAHITHKTAWDREFVAVGGTTYTLNHVEHRIIRPVFGDPRAHFALVCAARSCPPLRREAYTGAKLDEQLDDQARVFFATDASNRFDVENRTAWLSKILDWYRGDFARDDAGLLERIAPYLPADVRASIERDPAAWEVRHTRYDWSLNAQPRTEPADATASP